MSLAYILIPGLRLPSGIGSSILSECTAEETQALTSLGSGAETVHIQTFGPDAFRRAPHLVWLWRVLTRRNDAPQEAPWRWMALGGREQATQFWSIDPVTVINGKILEKAPELSFDEFMKITATVEPLLLKAGFRLQIWDNSWFGTRKEAWEAYASPRIAVSGLDETSLVVEGRDKNKLSALSVSIREILSRHPVNVSRRAKGLPAVDALWISGAGHEQLFFPPTLIRSVVCNDAAVRGWANASGILQERIGKESGKWPDAPAGDVIAVIDDLYSPWLHNDWETWRSRLTSVAEKANSYKAGALKFEARDSLVVAFGSGNAATLAPAAEKNILKKLFARPRSLKAADWCIEGIPS